MENHILEQWTQDRYTPDEGQVSEGAKVFCGVCKTQMSERRGCEGPRSSVEAMAKFKSRYDHFYCPHSNDDWHKQVIALRQQYDRTVSKVIRSLLLGEIELIMQSRTATIEHKDLKEALFWASIK